MDSRTLRFSYGHRIVPAGLVVVER